MDPRISQILRENANDVEHAEKLISQIVKEPFIIHRSNGELFIEFADASPSDNVNFDGYRLLEE